MVIVEVSGDPGVIGFWEGVAIMAMKRSFAAWAIPVLLKLLVTVMVLYSWRLHLPGVAESAVVILTPLVYSLFSWSLSGRLWLPLAASLLGFVIDAGAARLFIDVVGGTCADKLISAPKYLVWVPIEVLHFALSALTMLLTGFAIRRRRPPSV